MVKSKIMFILQEERLIYKVNMCLCMSQSEIDIVSHSNDFADNICCQRQNMGFRSSSRTVNLLKKGQHKYLPREKDMSTCRVRSLMLMLLCKLNKGKAFVKELISHILTLLLCTVFGIPFLLVSVFHQKTEMLIWYF